MNKNQLDEMLNGMCAKRATKVIYSSGKVVVHVHYEKMKPIITTVAKEV